MSDEGRVMETRERDVSDEGRAMEARERDVSDEGRVMEARERDVDSKGRVMETKERDVWALTDLNLCFMFLTLLHTLCQQEDVNCVPLCPQAQQLLHTICYPAGLPGSLDVSESDHKQLINRVLMVRPRTSSHTIHLCLWHRLADLPCVCLCNSLCVCVIVSVCLYNSLCVSV